MNIWYPPSDEEQMEIARRKSGGHPVGEIIGKQDLVAQYKGATPAYRKEQAILREKAKHRA